MRKIEIAYKQLQTVHHSLLLISMGERADEVADMMRTLWEDMDVEEKVRGRKHLTDLEKLSWGSGIFPAERMSEL